MNKEEAIKIYTDAVNAGSDYEALTVTVSTLAHEYGVSIPTIRGVLVNDGVYVSKPKKVKAENSMDKAAIVKALEIVTGKSLASFKNASEKDLKTMWNWVVSTSDRKEADK